MALLQINAAYIYTIFIGLLLVFTYWSRWRRYFQLGMKLPGPPAMFIMGNCLQFTSNDLCKLFREFTEIAPSYAPIARLQFGPVLLVVLTDPDSIEIVVKHEKLYSRGYLARKSMEQALHNGLL